MKTNPQETPAVSTSMVSSKEQEEQVTHAEIMQALKSFYKFVSYEKKPEKYWPCHNILIHHYQITPPSDELLKKIIKRGNHEEIMALIRAYHADPPKAYGNGSVRINNGPLSMPLFLENYIAQRGNQEEIQEFCKKRGFNAAAEEILLTRGDHEELMFYIGLHSLSAEAQKKLIARGNVAEIRHHIRNHALATELLDKLIAEVKANKTDNFYAYMKCGYIPKSHQKSLLEAMNTKVFLSYIEQHDFSSDILPEMVKQRTDEEIAAYIKKHHHLGDGVYELGRRSWKLINQYMQEAPYVDWFKVLTPVLNIDEDFLVKVYLQTPKAKPITKAAAEELDLFMNGTPSAIMAYLKEKRETLRLSDKAAAALFFRNNVTAFKHYLDYCTQKEIPHS